MTELDQSLKSLKFLSVLRTYSSDKNDPISEWEYHKRPYMTSNEYQGEADGKRCICTTPITNLHEIKNRISGKILEIGCECVKRWELNPYCHGKCGRSLGNLEARRKANNWLCRSCKAAKEKREEVEKVMSEIEQKKNDEETERMGHFLFFGFGKYYKKRFSEVVEDKEIVERLLNNPIDNDDYRTFIEYIYRIYRVEG